MKQILTGVLILGMAAGCASPTKKLVLVDFGAQRDVGGWEVEDDVVMGGRSKGSFIVKTDGGALFSGDVSLENDGGFSSIQYYVEPIDVSAYRTANLRLKGDGKSYLFILEAEKNSPHYYVCEFQTGTDWQTVKIPLSSMYPVRRGDRLDIPKFPGKTLAQIRIMIANQKAESFRLEVDRIWLQ